MILAIALQVVGTLLIAWGAYGFGRENGYEDAYDEIFGDLDDLDVWLETE